MSADRVMFVLILLGLITQFLCMILSAMEMMLSEIISRNSTQEFYSSRAASLQILSSIGDILRPHYLAYMLRYTGLILHFLAVYALLYVLCNRKRNQKVKLLLLTSGCTLLLQIFGVAAQSARLVVLLWYTIQHACDSDIANFEPNHVILGIATAIGFLSFIIHIGYVIACMYDKSVKYDEVVQANKTLRKRCERKKLVYKYGSFS